MTLGETTTPWLVPIVGMVEPFLIIALLDAIQNKPLAERIEHNKRLLLWSPFNGVSTILLDQVIRGGLLDQIFRAMTTPVPSAQESLPMSVQVLTWA